VHWLASLAYLASFVSCDAPPAGPAEPPRLVVLIVIDQFPAWVLPKVQPHLAPAGLRRLFEQGAWFEQAYFPQAATITGPGHAMIATGALPAGHGIAGNVWYDRSIASPDAREVYCVRDDSVRIIGGPAAGETPVSPRLLTATTFGDELRVATGFRSRIVAASMKDRGAVLLAGHTGKSFWYSAQSGRFLSSTYYYDIKPPGWADQFNAARPAEKHLRSRWSLLLDPAQYAAPPDDRPFEMPPKGLGRTFPHVLGTPDMQVGGDYFKLLAFTPAGVGLLLDFGRAAIAGEQLGSRGVTDVLALSLSSNDYVGHAFGPESIEYLDLMLQTDRLLEKFFADLDRSVGAGRWLAVLTSDHGAAPSPEYLREQGMPVGRVDPGQLVAAADKALDDAFGTDDWVATLHEPGIFLRPEPLRKHKLSPAAAQRAAAAACQRVTGISEVFAASDLVAGRLPDSAVARAAAATLHPDRSPDLIVVPKPYWYLDREIDRMAAMHGTPYPYDAHVPVVFYGPGIPAGRRADRVSITDIAATLATILRTSAPSHCEGKSLIGPAALRPGHSGGPVDIDRMVAAIKAARERVGPDDRTKLLEP